MLTWWSWWYSVCLFFMMLNMSVIHTAIFYWNLHQKKKKTLQATESGTVWNHFPAFLWSWMEIRKHRSVFLLRNLFILTCSEQPLVLHQKGSCCEHGVGTVEKEQGDQARHGQATLWIGIVLFPVVLSSQTATNDFDVDILQETQHNHMESFYYCMFHLPVS